MKFTPTHVSLWERIKLLFVRPEVYWAHEEGLVTKFKRMGGVLYVVKQEPIAYGDLRNYQISRLYGPLTTATVWVYRE